MCAANSVFTSSSTSRQAAQYDKNGDGFVAASALAELRVRSQSAQVGFPTSEHGYGLKMNILAPSGAQYCGTIVGHLRHGLAEMTSSTLIKLARSTPGASTVRKTAHRYFLRSHFKQRTGNGNSRTHTGGPCEFKTAETARNERAEQPLRNVTLSVHKGHHKRRLTGRMTADQLAVVENHAVPAPHCVAKRRRNCSCGC